MVDEAEPDDELIEPASRVRIGVAGWSYPDWEGIVYPRASRRDGLTFLARYFDTVEINSPFYRIPSARTSARWSRPLAAHPNFRITLKLYRGFTHERRPQADDERAFKAALTPLLDSGVLGALLLQFPWSFKNEPASLTYLDDLLGRFREFPLVVEVRHRSWNKREFHEFLAERVVGFCNIDQPVIGRSLPPTDLATGPVGYVRLHGRNEKEWFRNDAGRDARYDYLYTEEELEPWAEKISEVSGNAAETYVITNNHFRGQAVVNALQIRARIERKKVKAPASLVEHYPILRKVAEIEAPSQGNLF